MKPTKNTIYIDVTPVDAECIVEQLDKLLSKKDENTPVWPPLDK